MQIEGGKSMIISLCGDEFDKNSVIKELEAIYKDKLVICDFYKIFFKTKIETENIKYKLDSKCESLESSYRMYIKYVNKIVSNKIDEFLENNKNKIILLISNNILSKDVNKTPYFKKSDLKILITSEKKFKDSYSVFDHKKLYDKNKFDCVFDTGEEIDIKKLVKL